MSKVIISCAVGYGHGESYEGLLLEQRRSHADRCPELDRLDWLGVWPPGSRAHRDSPYGFKVWAFKAAREAGYRQVLWLDSCMTLLRHPQPIFDLIGQHGFFTVSGGGPFADYARSPFAEAAKPGWTIAAGQTLGFDFDSITGTEIFEAWAKLEAENGFTEMGVPKHRWDETCLGYIMGLRNLPMLDGPETGHYLYPNPILWSYWLLRRPYPTEDELVTQASLGAAQLKEMAEKIAA